MLKSCTRKYTDESDEDAFRFTFYCDRCGSPHSIASVKFSGNGPPDTLQGKKLWKMTWQKEHAQAFERANFEAKYHFFCCPGCGEYVCQNCIVSEALPSGELRDLCLNCNRRIAQKKNAPMRMVPGTGPPAQNEPKGNSLWKRIRGSRQSPKE